jgi:FtsZ-binding cell division protein ZapB
MPNHANVPPIGSAPDPLPVMRREMKLLLIEISQLRGEVEQLRAKKKEAQNAKEFLHRVIESRDQWRREAQRLRALMAKVPPWLLFCGRCLDAFKASREACEGLDLHQSPSQCP